jgi:hypothetical protein
MPPIDLRGLAGDLFTGGTALAGLILVFLGGILSAYDSFPAEDKNFVRHRYRRNGTLALGGFLAALVAAILALIAKWCVLPAFLWSAAVVLALAFGFVILLAVIAFSELI